MKIVPVEKFQVACQGAKKGGRLRENMVSAEDVTKNNAKSDEVDRKAGKHKQLKNKKHVTRL